SLRLHFKQLVQYFGISEGAIRFGSRRRGGGIIHKFCNQAKSPELESKSNTSETPQSMSFFQTRVNKRRAILMLVCLLGLGVGLLLLRPESRPPAPVVLLPLPYKAPVRVPMPDRWIPPSWGWLWRLKESILGKRKVISLDIAGFDLEDRSEAFLSALSLRPPDCADTNGIKVWLIGEAEFAGLR